MTRWGKGGMAWKVLAATVLISMQGYLMDVRAEPDIPALTGPAELEAPVLPEDNPIRVGSVEGFTMDRVYIDGMDYVLSKHIEYYSSLGEPVRRPWVKQGSRVKYVLGPDREIEIIQLIRNDDDE